MNIKDMTVKKTIIILLLLIISCAVIFNIDSFITFLKIIFNVISPLIMGIVIAFIFNILMVKYEKLLFKKDIKKGKNITGIKRVTSILLTYLTVGLILFLIILLLIPEIFSSIRILVDNIGNYTNQIKDFGSKLLTNNTILENMFGVFMDSWLNTSHAVVTWFINNSPKLFSSFMGLFGSILNFFLGLFFSIYLLYNKEKNLIGLKKVMFAYLPKSKADKILKIGTITSETFANFVNGQLIEAVILGTFCTLGMLLLKMPYAVLIGVIIGVTSVIPLLGAYIGAIPSAFLLLMEDPISAIIFILFLIILQQFEGNVIYPKVVGKSVGLSGMWILIAVVIGAGAFGAIGVLIGVPLCAVIYYLLKEDVNKKLKKKKIKIA